MRHKISFPALAVIGIIMMSVSCRKKVEEPPPDQPVVAGITEISPVSGYEFAEITITGTELPVSQNNLVIMGGYYLKPSYSDPTSVVFRVPAGIAPGSYKITLFAGGKYLASSENFTVVTDPSQGPFTPSGSIPVTATRLKECFTGMKLGGVHPRLIFSSADIDRIKTISSQDLFAKATYDNIINRAGSIMQSPILDWGLDGANLRISSIHTVANDHIPNLVLAYRFTKNPSYAERCWLQLDKMCSWQDWGAARHFLDAGIGAKGAAIAYDGLYDYLSIQQKQKLAAAIRKFVLEPGKTQIETQTGAWKWYNADNNWNGICHGGMIMAALALFETDPDFMSSVISVAANGMMPYLNSLLPDGASEEGMGYWGYGLSNTFLAFESMKRNLGTTFGLTELEGFRKTGWFPYLVSGPAGTATMGDDNLYYGRANKVLSYFWFARQNNDPNLAKTHYNACLDRNSAKSEKMNGWIDLLFYDPALVGQGNNVQAPLNGYIRGAEYMYVSEGNDPEALYFGMHAGDNNASHGHLDAGTFFIQALGENFIVGNLGREEPYPSDYFSTTAPDYSAAPTNTASTRGRFYYYRVRTESKSCLVMNPDARPEQNPKGIATVSGQSADSEGGFYVVNLSGCYNRDVTAYRRGIKLNRSAGVVTVQDEFTPKSQTVCYWLAQSPATDGMQISADGRTATMTKNGKTFYAFLRSPVNAVFEKADRSETEINYLPETRNIFGTLMAGKNSINKLYGKLQVKLSVPASTPVVIRVDFSASGTPTEKPLSQLSDWTTAN